MFTHTHVCMNNTIQTHMQVNMHVRRSMLINAYASYDLMITNTIINAHPKAGTNEYESEFIDEH